MESLQRMTVVLARRADINMDSFRRVAWRGEPVRLAEPALKAIADCRRSFLELIENDPSVVIYGVTTAMGERANRRLDARGARLGPRRRG